MIGGRVPKNVAEVFVIGHQDHRSFDGKSQHLGIRRVLLCDILQANYFESRPSKETYRGSVNAMIGEDQARGSSSTT